MIEHSVRTYPSNEPLARQDELAYKLAEVSVDPVPVTDDVTAMIVNRIIDNAAVAAASLHRRPVATARAQAMQHPIPLVTQHSDSAAERPKFGATVYGVSGRKRVSPEWATWANGVAVRELDFHDTFLAADYAHPGDNIPAITAVAQHCGSSGAEVVRALATAYEVQVDLVTGICLHAHKIDHIAHLGPSVAAGLGTLLRLPVEVTYQAINQSLHTTTTTRQSRKGHISSWKAFAPAFAGKVAIEAVDRAMRGEDSPAPIYEGEDGVIAWLLDGPKARYTVPLPAPGEPKRAILRTFTKEHSAEYQSQAFIDLARKMRASVPDTAAIDNIVIYTSHHTHNVIGTGSNDPQKFDPQASRETLDHSLMYIFAVALTDGEWHHVRSYDRQRATRADTVRLWQRISTVEDSEWTRRYHASAPDEQAFGGKVVITFKDGSQLADELAVADAHPRGARPFGREEYVAKFRQLADGVVSEVEQERFLALAQRLPKLSSEQLGGLTIVGHEVSQSQPILESERVPEPRAAQGIF